MKIVEVVQQPLIGVDSKGETVVLVKNLAQRFLRDVEDYLYMYKHTPGFDDLELKTVLEIVPLVTSLFEKSKEGNVANESVTREGLQALATYLSWSYTRNEGQDIRAGTNQPTDRSSRDMRELFRQITGCREDTATYTMPVGYYKCNQAEI